MILQQLEVTAPRKVSDGNFVGVKYFQEFIDSGFREVHTHDANNHSLFFKSYRDGAVIGKAQQFTRIAFVDSNFQKTEIVEY